MILYRLSFLKYVKEKVKEILSISGRCKGDIFLNPNMKAGQDILREGYHDDHIIHALKYFASKANYGDHYGDLNAGFGAIAAEVVQSFKHNSLYEADDPLRSVLLVNMSLKSPHDNWTILTSSKELHNATIVRCENADDVKSLLSYGGQIIFFQSKDHLVLHAPHHDAYSYSAQMDKNRPFKTLWTLITMGYAYSLKRTAEAEDIAQGDYIFLPKDYPL
ncbi:MAG: hypothetical protein K9G26_09840 [Emcibacter sp.]|nr:hypothetical protein [Emcibacter sp.]